MPKWRTITKVVIPTSIAGIASGITLAIARVIGETAPLLIAVGITTGVNFNPFDGRMATLPVFSYYSYVAPGVPREPFIDRAWTAALVLIIFVMVLNLAARLIARVSPPRRPAAERPERMQMSKSIEVQNLDTIMALPRRGRRQHVDPPADGHALIGPSGCGKTTLLRVMNRMNEVIPGGTSTVGWSSTGATSTARA